MQLNKKHYNALKVYLGIFQCMKISEQSGRTMIALVDSVKDLSELIDAYELEQKEIEAEKSKAIEEPKEEPKEDGKS
jgi:hypothetical protein